MKSFLTLLLTVALLIATVPTRESHAQDPRLFSKGTADELATAQTLTNKYLNEHRARFGLDDKNGTQVLRSWIDEESMAHVRLQQTFNGVPVFGAQLISHLNSDGAVFGLSDGWISAIEVDTTPTISAKSAKKIARALVDCSDCEPRSELWVQQHNKVDRLVYEVRMPQLETEKGPSMPVYFIDAHSGEFVWGYDNLQTATGIGLYNGNVNFNSYQGVDNYYLEDVERRLGTYSFRNGTVDLFNLTDADDIWTNATAVDAHFAMSSVFDYFKNVHGRNGMNGNGGPFYHNGQNGLPMFTAGINYSVHYVNAFWNGDFLVFGDGDGNIASPLVSSDIVGHEMTHALTESSAGLIYSGESGALNESMSDVFGAMVERSIKGESGNTWAIGEQCYTPGTTGDAFRFMDDPHKASSMGNSGGDPDHYAERYRGTSDNGGVHANAGISNKAFYLLSQGGTHHMGGSMVGIGADDAAKIWFKALTEYMTPTTDFAGARTATVLASTALFGTESTQTAAVKQAWTLVGVLGDVPPPEPPATTILQNNVAVTNLSAAKDAQKLFVLSVPSGATNLQFKTSGGTGDADLYVKFGAMPTTTNYDCRPYTAGNTETCSFSNPTAGDYYVMINGYASYSGVSLVGSYTAPQTVTDFITNGGFEFVIAPWSLTGDAIFANDFSARNGRGYVRLGQRSSAGEVTQTFTIPSAARTANLTFFVNVVSDEGLKVARDQLFVEIRTTSGKLLATVATYSNVDKSVVGNYAAAGPFSLLKYRGQTVKLVFRSTSNNQLPTTFRIDDVSVK